MLQLSHSCDNRYNDLFVRISEVDARGRSRNVSDGYLCATPDSRNVRIELDAIAHRFPRRIAHPGADRRRIASAVRPQSRHRRTIDQRAAAGVGHAHRAPRRWRHLAARAARGAESAVNRLIDGFEPSFLIAQDVKGRRELTPNKRRRNQRRFDLDRNVPGPLSCDRRGASFGDVRYRLRGSRPEKQQCGCRHAGDRGADGDNLLRMGVVFMMCSPRGVAAPDGPRVHVGGAAYPASDTFLENFFAMGG